jgi:hypothetical protein
VRLYHYTRHLQEILSSGAIWTEDKLPSWKRLPSEFPHPRPGVWLTTRNSSYEPTAFPKIDGKLITSVQELAQHCQPARIIVPDSTVTLRWKEWAALHSPAAQSMIQRLKTAATKVGGDVMSYRVSLTDIPFDGCHFQVWNDGWGEGLDSR